MKKKQRSYKRILELQDQQSLLLKSVVRVETGPFHLNGWDIYFKELSDKALLRKDYKKHIQGLYMAKFDFYQNKYIVKRVRGPTETKYNYTTPQSVSLVPKFGKMRLYGSSVDNDAYSNKFMNVGLLLNLNQCQFKEKHVYTKDGMTGSYRMRYWRESSTFESKEAAQEIADFMNEDNSDYMKKLRNIRGVTTLDELRKSTAEDKIYHYGELLVGVHEDAIEGIFAEFHTDDKNPTAIIANYANKVFALYQQKLFKDKFSIDVPVVLQNPKLGLIEYSKAEVKADIQFLIDNPEISVKVFELISEKKFGPDNDIEFGSAKDRKEIHAVLSTMLNEVREVNINQNENTSNTNNLTLSNIQNNNSKEGLTRQQSQTIEENSEIKFKNIIAALNEYILSRWNNAAQNKNLPPKSMNDIKQFNDSRDSTLFTFSDSYFHKLSKFFGEYSAKDKITAALKLRSLLEAKNDDDADKIIKSFNHKDFDILNDGKLGKVINEFKKSLPEEFLEKFEKQKTEKISTWLHIKSSK